MTLFGTKTIRDMKHQKMDRMWQQSYTYSILFFFQEVAFIIYKFVANVVTRTLGILGILALLAFFQRRGQVSILLMLSVLSVHSIT